MTDTHTDILKYWPRALSESEDKNKDGLKNKDKLKNKDSLKNKDDHKNEGDLKKEDYLNAKTSLKLKTTAFRRPYTAQAYKTLFVLDSYHPIFRYYCSQELQHDLLNIVCSSFARSTEVFQAHNENLHKEFGKGKTFLKGSYSQTPS